MGVKARAEMTLSSIRDVQSVTRYYLLQSSTSAAPAKPTTNPPGGNWVTTEPTYTSGSTNSLYFTDCTVFSDETFAYSDVSLSSSYEAAKVAYNKAENAEGIAERATHSMNLIPFGSRSWDDTHYWYNGFLCNGTVSSQYIFNSEQLEDGWIHICVDGREYTGTANYVSDAVIVRKSPSIKPGGLYTILYEVRNNNSIFSDVSGNNSYFYIVQENGKQFWGGGIHEILEGTGTTSTFTLRTMAPAPDTVYRKRFTKYEDNGAHGADPGFLFRLNFRYGKKDYVDFELRISIYEGRYLGDYMPYVVSDTTDLSQAISAAQATANGKNTVYYQASAPTGGTYKLADIWFDTNDGNKMYMYNGTTWVAEQFGNAAISDLSITNAKIANGTIESAKIANLDAGKITTGTMSAARIKGDTLTLGGDNDANGVMEVYNASGELVGSFTKEGLEVIAGTIAGWTIKPGEFYTEWNQSTRNYKARLSTRDGLKFESTDSEEGFEQYLRQTIFGAENTVFLNRGIDGVQTAGFLSGFRAPGNDPIEGGISVSPNLMVYGGEGAIYADKLYLTTDPNNTYPRQPQLIMKGNIIVKNGTSEKNVTLCTVPAAYQTDYYIIPFVSRTYGMASGTPDDAGDFYYAYYNHVNHTVHIKLANKLTAGVWYEYVYFIYALPKA